MKLKLFLISIPLILLTMFMLIKHNKSVIISTYNEYRPMLLTGGGEECLTSLKQIQASYKIIGDTGNASCPILNAVRVIKYANTTLSSPFIVSCPTALSVGNWLEDIKAKSIGHVGTINCRSRRGSGLKSEHSFIINEFVAGYGNTQSAVNSIQFKFDTGNIDAGKIKLYGIKDS